MRVVIAAGGTGGHIYPAVAVARSLRALPAAPELAWIGGHRGLEAGIVPATGIPFSRLALRSLRSSGRDVHSRARPAPPRGLVPAGALAAGPPAPGRHLHERWLRRDPDPGRGAPPADSRRPLGGQRRARPQRPGDRPAGGRGRGQLRGDLRRARRGALLRDRDARSATRARSTARRPASGWGSRRGRACSSSSAGRRRSGASTPRSRGRSRGSSSAAGCST